MCCKWLYDFRLDLVLIFMFIIFITVTSLVVVKIGRIAALANDSGLLLQLE